MEYVEVCDESGDCKKLSRLIMGTDHLGRNPEEVTFKILNEAVALGINTFDTAPIYVDEIEKTVGDWLRSRDSSELYTISKGGFPYDRGPGTYESRLKGSREQIADNLKEEIDGSSRRLNNDITIYLMHRDDADFKDYAIFPARWVRRLRLCYRWLGDSQTKSTGFKDKWRSILEKCL